jgi:hypothetical protein
MQFGMASMIALASSAARSVNTTTAHLLTPCAPAQSAFVTLNFRVSRNLRGLNVIGHGRYGCITRVCFKDANALPNNVDSHFATKAQI